ncbi:hypothetical protein WOSG25_071170 [Weissella oryzae SG25]|uniref:Uncharacterized protein n=1 Tax=Weissella oryzae (strain DSM 25784 / JCM 18191 / LMG 30913 / SG25) TaxID=1329250 RepID=A0A069CTJ1_WEIOS|nr:type II toxin-antitoxin system RelB/DinJ family antitoxin [Weissella oryzae]GAK31140.1 hypothetical protein WOSG25_071170 [Weissella oryzae SG25]
MEEKLIQLKISAETKLKADEILKQHGLSTQAAVKMFLTQIANTGRSPFDGIFYKDSSKP